MIRTRVWAISLVAALAIGALPVGAALADDPLSDKDVAAINAALDGAEATNSSPGVKGVAPPSVTGDAQDAVAAPSGISQFFGGARDSALWMTLAIAPVGAVTSEGLQAEMANGPNPYKFAGYLFGAAASLTAATAAKAFYTADKLGFAAKFIGGINAYRVDLTLEVGAARAAGFAAAAEAANVAKGAAQTRGLTYLVATLALAAAGYTVTQLEPNPVAALNPNPIDAGNVSTPGSQLDRPHSLR